MAQAGKTQELRYLLFECGQTRWHSVVNLARAADGKRALHLTATAPADDGSHSLSEQEHQRQLAKAECARSLLEVAATRGSFSSSCIRLLEPFICLILCLVSERSASAWPQCLCRL